MTEEQRLLCRVMHYEHCTRLATKHTSCLKRERDVVTPCSERASKRSLAKEATAALEAVEVDPAVDVKDARIAELEKTVTELRKELKCVLKPSTYITKSWLLSLSDREWV